MNVSELINALIDGGSERHKWPVVINDPEQKLWNITGAGEDDRLPETVVLDGRRLDKDQARTVEVNELVAEESRVYPHVETYRETQRRDYLNEILAEHTPVHDENKNDRAVIVSGHDSKMDPLTSMAWGLIEHQMPDGRTWTAREQSQRCLDFLHGNGYVVIKLRDLQAAAPDIQWTEEA